MKRNLLTGIIFLLFWNLSIAQIVSIQGGMSLGTLADDHSDDRVFSTYTHGVTAIANIQYWKMHKFFISSEIAYITKGGSRIVQLEVDDSSYPWANKEFRAYDDMYRNVHLGASIHFKAVDNKRSYLHLGLGPYLDFNTKSIFHPLNPISANQVHSVQFGFNGEIGVVNRLTKHFSLHAKASYLFDVSSMAETEQYHLFGRTIILSAGIGYIIENWEFD